MLRVAVESSAVRSMGWDEGLSAMDVERVNGKVYRYANVSASEYMEVTRAASIGAALNRLVTEKDKGGKLRHPVTVVEGGQ